MYIPEHDPHVGHVLFSNSSNSSFDLDKEADEIEKAVKAVLADGYRTVDIMSDGMKKVGCKEMGQLIIDQIK